MGRPALLGRHPRGPQYRGVHVPPHYGNRPRWRKSWQPTQHKTNTPKDISWRLASPLDSYTHPTPTDERHHTWADKTQEESAWNLTRSQTSTLLEDCCPGGPTRTGPGTAPLALVSEIAAISGVRDGHRNRKNRKNRCDFSALSPLYWSAEQVKSWFSGRGWGQQLFSFQIPAVQWFARTSSLNYLSCRNPYHTPHSLNCLTLLHWKTLFQWKVLRHIPFPKEGSDRCVRKHPQGPQSWEH